MESLLFACTLNAVRSPMAAALTRHLLGAGVQVESAGVEAGELDPLAVAAMAEIGITLDAHTPRRFEELFGEKAGGAFDLVITLSPEARNEATAHAPQDRIEYWPTSDPTQCEGSREQRLAGYRAVRDGLLARLKARFAGAG